MYWDRIHALRWIKFSLVIGTWCFLLCSKGSTSSNRSSVWSWFTRSETTMCQGIEKDIYSLWPRHGWCPQWCRVEWFSGGFVVSVFSLLILSYHGWYAFFIRCLTCFVDVKQVKCFNAPLQPAEIVGVKRVVQEKQLDGVNDLGLTLNGFLFLHSLFIEKGRLETTWAVLRKFGYGNDLELRDEFVPVPTKLAPDQVSLVNILTSLFRSCNGSLWFILFIFCRRGFRLTELFIILVFV